MSLFTRHGMKDLLRVVERLNIRGNLADRRVVEDQRRRQVGL